MPSSRILVLAAAVCLTSRAFGQKVGEKVEVDSASVMLKVGQETGAAVPKGTVLEVKNVNGEWIWVEFQGKSGWVRRAGVIPWISPEQKRDQAIQRGNDSLKKKDGSSASSAFDEALSFDSASYDALYGRGQALANLKKLDKAIEDFTAAIRLKANSAEAYAKRGTAFSGKGKTLEALEDYKKARSLGLKDSSILDPYAWELATSPYKEYRDAKLALTIALEACTLSESKDPWYFDTVAAAYAADGKFELAIEWATKLLNSKGNLSAKAKKDVSDRLALYQQGIPFRGSWKARNDFEKLVGPPPGIASFPQVVHARFAP